VAFYLKALLRVPITTRRVLRDGHFDFGQDRDGMDLKQDHRLLFDSIPYLQLVWKKLFFSLALHLETCLERPGMAEVSFCLTGIAWHG
jgi:hypothetical protein